MDYYKTTRARRSFLIKLKKKPGEKKKKKKLNAQFKKPWVYCKIVHVCGRESGRHNGLF
jgi:hypothetical protein